MRLLDKRYEEIKKIVVSLFTELNLYDVPIDCFKICERLGIRVVKYSDVNEEKRKACKEFSKDGFCMEIEENGQSVFYIFYDDSMYDRRIRFTIMHEIGHIVLDHTEHSDLAESEANFFAKYALAPPPLVHKYKPEDYCELAEIFQLSQEFAMNAMKFYHRWLRYGPRNYLDYEIVLLDLFDKVHT
ncbi:MAG: ImmA/IrrE family metallo-endopeptidase [Clostridia bacterium]|nr:ImmA/IrrE family metallo-endopeptidase [Clostridia bacterium]